MARFAVVHRRSWFRRGGWEVVASDKQSKYKLRVWVSTWTEQDAAAYAQELNEQAEKEPSDA